MSSRSCVKIKLLSALFVFGLLTYAQSAHKSTGPKYDTANEIKIKGVVEEIRQVPGEFEGTHLVVKTDSQTYLVHCAPETFLKEMDTTFAKGDQVAVVGAKAPDVPDEILAREITDGANTVTLRDDKGIPIWAGWKPAKGQ